MPFYCTSLKNRLFKKATLNDTCLMTFASSDRVETQQLTVIKRRGGVRRWKNLWHCSLRSLLGYLLRWSPMRKKAWKGEKIDHQIHLDKSRRNKAGQCTCRIVQYCPVETRKVNGKRNHSALRAKIECLASLPIIPVRADIWLGLCMVWIAKSQNKIGKLMPSSPAFLNIVSQNLMITSCHMINSQSLASTAKDMRMQHPCLCSLGISQFIHPIHSCLAFKFYQQQMQVTCNLKLQQKRNDTPEACHSFCSSLLHMFLFIHSSKRMPDSHFGPKWMRYFTMIDKVYQRFLSSISIMDLLMPNSVIFKRCCLSFLSMFRTQLLNS